MMANLVLNFASPPSSKYVYCINTGLASEAEGEVVIASEESFARVAHDMEALALPVARFRRQSLPCPEEGC